MREEITEFMAEELRQNTQQFIKNGVETVERTGKAGLVARDALAKWEGRA